MDKKLPLPESTSAYAYARRERFYTGLKIKLTLYCVGKDYFICQERLNLDTHNLSREIDKYSSMDDAERFFEGRILN